MWLRRGALATRARAIAVFVWALPVAGEVQSVLFIGNSFTYAHGGVWAMYQAVAQACIPGLVVNTAEDVAGARTLSMSTWGSPADAVQNGNYNILVLQDQSDLMMGDSTDAVRTFFAPQAKSHNAFLGLYQTWAKPEQGNYTANTLWRARVYQRYADAARAAGVQRVLTARAGEAFLEILSMYSGDIDERAFRSLYDFDDEHPSLLGVNLVAWVMVLAFNPEKFPPTGCDVARVPNVAGQSDDQKRVFADVACRLAGVCPPAAPVPPPPLCALAKHVQGSWERQTRSPEATCKAFPRAQLPPQCIVKVEWDVSGTQVLRRAAGVEERHSLRVKDYGAFCSLKLLPDRVYVSKVTHSKVVLNDCQVWTRVGSRAQIETDECVCVGADNWRDQDGDSCTVYEAGQRKATEHDCIFGYGGMVSQGKGLYAWQACAGCQKCQIALRVHPAELLE